MICFLSKEKRLESERREQGRGGEEKGNLKLNEIE